MFNSLGVGINRSIPGHLKEATWQVFLSLTKWNSSSEVLSTAVDLISSGLVDWSLFRELVVSHGVIPIVVRNISLIKNHTSIPLQLLLELKALKMIVSSRARILNQKEAEIMSVLTDTGIKAKFLKGPGFSRRLFGDPAARQSGDLDLIVSEKELPSIHKVFQSIGFQLLPKTHAFHNTYILSDTIHGEIVVEVHYLLSRPYLGIKDEDLIRLFLVTEGFNKWELFLLVLHMSRHKTLRWKWLCDIDVYLTYLLREFSSYSIMRSALIDSARRFGMQNMMEICLKLRETTMRERIMSRRDMRHLFDSITKIWFVPGWSKGWWAKFKPYIGKYWLINGLLKRTYHLLRYPPALAIILERRQNMIRMNHLWSRGSFYDE